MNIDTTEKRSFMPQLPCLMEGLLEPHLVVLFTTRQSGMVIRGAPGVSLGFFKITWIRYDDTTTWKPWDGSVTLKND